MERYDIRPMYDGTGWAVVDNGNGGGIRSVHPTREEALKVAKRLER